MGPTTPPTQAPTAADLQADPVVQSALAQAWTDSQPSDPTQRHEEGGWIYMNTATGSLTVQGAPRGTQNELELGQPLLSGDQALRIAAADAEAAYRDLSNCRITLSLEHDGWHIEYDLKNATAAGGGPHYVIDASTGAILSKVYYQQFPACDVPPEM